MQNLRRGRQNPQAEGPFGLEALGLQLKQQSRRSTRAYRRWQRARQQAGQLLDEQDIPPHLPDGQINPEAEAVRDTVDDNQLRGKWRSELAVSLRTARQILRVPANDLAGFSVRYTALLWLLFHDGMEDSIDPLHLRQLRAFGRQMRKAVDPLHRRQQRHEVSGTDRRSRDS